MPLDIAGLGNRIWALIDTGSSKSYIGKKGLSYIPVKFRKRVAVPSFSAIVANGGVCSIGDSYKVDVELAGKPFNLVLNYLPTLTVPILLGLDVITQLGMNMSPDSQWWFENSPDSKQRFYSNPPFEIPLNSNTCGIQVLGKGERDKLEAIVNKGIVTLRDGPGKTNLITHKIDTGDASPIKLKAYRYSPKVLEAMYSELDDYLKQGIVEPSFAEWASPVVMVRQGDKYRFCVDYRRVNAVSRKDSYPMPNMSHLLDGLRQAKYLSKIDLKQAFLQVPLADEHSRDVTSFIVPGRGLFRFTAMPFGLSGSPATFQRLADRVFGPELFPYVVVYLDDLLICTPDFESHCKMLGEVFRRLKEAGLRVNEEKCEFGCSEV